MLFSFREALVHFLMSSFGFATALLVIAGLIGVVRYLGWRGPVEVGEWLYSVVFERKRHPPVSTEHINVDYRDASGVLMDLTPYVKTIMRNGLGGTFFLDQGTFIECDASVIRAGKTVDVSIQNGLIRERLVVRLDRSQSKLYVQSAYLIQGVFDAIDGKRPVAPVAAIRR